MTQTVRLLTFSIVVGLIISAQISIPSAKELESQIDEEIKSRITEYRSLSHKSTGADWPTECKAVEKATKFNCGLMDQEARYAVQSCHKGRWCDYSWNWYWWKCDFKECIEYDFCSDSHKFYLQRVDSKTIYSKTEVRDVLKRMEDQKSEDVNKKCLGPISFYLEKYTKVFVDNGADKQAVNDAAYIALYDAMIAEWN